MFFLQPPGATLLCNRAGRETCNNPESSQGPLPERTHLSSLYSDLVLTDAVDAERRGALFTVIVSECALRAVHLRRAATAVVTQERSVRA